MSVRVVAVLSVLGLFGVVPALALGQADEDALIREMKFVKVPKEDRMVTTVVAGRAS